MKPQLSTKSIELFIRTGSTVSDHRLTLLLLLGLFIDAPGISACLLEPIRMVDLYVLAPILGALHLYTLVVLFWPSISDQASRLYFSIFGALGFCIYGIVIQKVLSAVLGMPELIWLAAVALYVGLGCLNTRWFWNRILSGRHHEQINIWPFVIAFFIMIVLLLPIDLVSEQVQKWIMYMVYGTVLLSLAWILASLAVISWARYRLQPIYQQQVTQEATQRKLRKIQNRKKRRR